MRAGEWNFEGVGDDMSLCDSAIPIVVFVVLNEMLGAVLVICELLFFILAILDIYDFNTLLRLY
jgi:hypothetical protein